MTTITAPLAAITLEALLPDVVRSCILLQPSPPPEPGEETPDPVGDTGIYTPVAPGVTYPDLPDAPTIIDTSPDQMVGCIITVADNPQGRLNALFPSAVDGDGVIDRASNDIWVYDGAVWNNVGPTPGPTIVVEKVVPPWNEIVLAQGRTRTKLTALSLDYALELLTEVDPITTRTRLNAGRVLPVAGAVGISGAVPSVSTGVAVPVGAAAVTLAAAMPAVVGGAQVSVPTGAVTIAGEALEFAGRQRAVVLVPAADVNAGAAVPQTAIGAAISIPVVSVAVAAFGPSFPRVAPQVVAVGTAATASATLTVTAGAFIENDIQVIVIETSGNGSTLTPPSGWEAVTGSPVIDVASIAGSTMQVWWTRKTGSGSSYSVTVGDSGDHTCGRVYTIRGCVTTGNPWDVLDTNFSATAETTAEAPSVTTSTDECLIFVALTRPEDTSSTAGFGTASNANLASLTNHGAFSTTSGNGGGFVAVSGVKSSPGETGVTSFSMPTASTYTAMTIAFTSYR